MSTTTATQTTATTPPDIAANVIRLLDPARRAAYLTASTPTRRPSTPCAYFRGPLATGAAWVKATPEERSAILAVTAPLGSDRATLTATAEAASGIGRAEVAVIRRARSKRNADRHAAITSTPRAVIGYIPGLAAEAADTYADAFPEPVRLPTMGAITEETKAARSVVTVRDHATAKDRAVVPCSSGCGAILAARMGRLVVAYCTACAPMAARRLGAKGARARAARANSRQRADRKANGTTTKAPSPSGDTPKWINLLATA